MGLTAKTLTINTDWGRPGSKGKYGGVGWYRLINGWEDLGANVIKSEYRLEGANSIKELKEKGEVLITKLMDGEEVVRQLLVLREVTNSRLVLDLDDDPFNINVGHPNYEHFKERQELYKYFIKEADHIICSTQLIADTVKPYNNKISIIPNSINRKIWKNIKKTRKKDKKIRIGWFGSGSHITDLPMTMEFMSEILEKYPQVEFHLAGIVTEKIGKDRVIHHIGTEGYQEYPQFIADMNIDIAIAPLENNQFNRCKSNIKWLEHSMLKIPMVLSDVAPYSKSVDNYKTGFLAKNKNQWIKYLSWLIENKEKRKEIGNRAYEEVLKNWTLEKQLHKYEEVIERVRKKNIVVYTSIVGGKDNLLDNQNTIGADFIAFTDQKSNIWKTLEPYNRFKDNRRNSRIQKIMPHLFFPDYEYSIYIDGNITIKIPAQELIDKYLGDKDIAVVRHSGRDCIYDEANAIVGFGFEEPAILANQIKEYSKRGIKEHSGLAECGFMIRRNTKEVARMNEKWWAEYTVYSKRDQLSFPIAFDFSKINFIELPIWRNQDFTMVQHTKSL